MAHFKIARYRFTPKVIPTIATFLVIPALIALGMWQISRYGEKQDMLNLYQARRSTIPLTLKNLKKIGPDLRYYPLKLTGKFDNQHQILLDNKIYHHKVGYQVITPFIANGEKKAVLVNRGWIAAGTDRHRLPGIENVMGEVTVLGSIYVPSKKTFVLSNKVENANQWPLRMQTVDHKQLSKLTHLNFYPFTLLLNKNQPYGFVRDWKPIHVDPQRHLGYAITWFTCAIVVFLLFIFLNLHKGGLPLDEKPKKRVAGS